MRRLSEDARSAIRALGGLELSAFDRMTADLARGNEPDESDVDEVVGMIERLAAPKNA